MREEQKERALLLGVKLNDGEDFKIYGRTGSSV